LNFFTVWLLELASLGFLITFVSGSVETTTIGATTRMTTAGTIQATTGSTTSSTVVAGAGTTTAAGANNDNTTKSVKYSFGYFFKIL